MKEKISWTIKAFSDLSGAELYEILRLRSEVFVVEQECVFLDMDNLDQKAYHLTGRTGDELVACARILPAGTPYEEPSIGRVVSSPRFRRTGAGMELMDEAVKATMKLHGNVAIKIGAQLYLKQFYEKHGFVQCSEMYFEDKIPHIKMIRNPITG